MHLVEGLGTYTDATQRYRGIYYARRLFQVEGRHGPFSKYLGSSAISFQLLIHAVSRLHNLLCCALLVCPQLASAATPSPEAVAAELRDAALAGQSVAYPW